MTDTVANMAQQILVRWMLERRRTHGPLPEPLRLAVTRAKNQLLIQHRDLMGGDPNANYARFRELFVAQAEILAGDRPEGRRDG